MNVTSWSYRLTRSWSTSNGGTPSVLALSTLSKNNWQYIQLQQEHTSTAQMVKGHLLVVKTFAAPLPNHPRKRVRLLGHMLTHSWSTVELQAFSHLPFFQRTTDNTYSSSMNTRTRHWGHAQTPPTAAINSASNSALSPNPPQNRRKPLTGNTRFRKNWLHTKRSWLTPLWALFSNSKRSWRRAANVKCLN